MPGLEIQPFSEEHLDAAAGLLAERHRRHREAEPLLTEPADYRAEVEADWRGAEASGAVGLRDGRVVGYLLGLRKDDKVWGPNVWVDPAGHAVEQAEDLRDLYAAAAERWVDEGRTRHYAVVPASDARLLEAWYRLSFGQQQALAVREVPDAAMPANVRPAEERDIAALVELGPLLPDYQGGSPVFSTWRALETEEELRQEVVDDLANPELGLLVAEEDGRIVGGFELAPTKLSSTHRGLACIDGSVLLGWAVTRPEVRGSGAGIALTEASFAWARERGYEVMVTDWRVTNLLSSRFWPRRGFRETFLRLYRSIP
ncbi:MAG TPA: GNAT family N-acetyltransferase [Gaiellaceae bacterium]|nr:GNAT family N-acetyltransferase [Gaiellaceae bacterium]